MKGNTQSIPWDVLVDGHDVVVVVVVVVVDDDDVVVVDDDDDVGSGVVVVALAVAAVVEVAVVAEVDSAICGRFEAFSALFRKRETYRAAPSSTPRYPRTRKYFPRFPPKKTWRRVDWFSKTIRIKTIHLHWFSYIYRVYEK